MQGSVEKVFPAPPPYRILQGCIPRAPLLDREGPSPWEPLIGSVRPHPPILIPPLPSVRSDTSSRPPGPPARESTRISGCCPYPNGPRESARRVDMLKPSHDGHMPHGERDPGSATTSIPPPRPPPLGRRESSGLGEDGLLFLQIPGLPCPQALPSPCTLVSLPLHVPVSLQSRVPPPTQALPCSCTSVSLSPGCSSWTGCSEAWLGVCKGLLAWPLNPR